MKWHSSLSPRLASQFNFLIEIDKLKNVLRATRNLHNQQPENSAEHSWHLAMIAAILAEHARRPVHVDRVIKMLLIHDLVEIDAGDHPLHGDHDPQAQAQAEIAGADRIFGLLPQDQANEWRALWDEFEAAQSADAEFAKGIDRFQPLLCNLYNEGGSWPEYNVTQTQLHQRIGKIERSSETLWSITQAIIEDGIEHGWIKPE